jgi:hypothetical protein
VRTFKKGNKIYVFITILSYKELYKDIITYTLILLLLSTCLAEPITAPKSNKLDSIAKIIKLTLITREEATRRVVA